MPERTSLLGSSEHLCKCGQPAGHMGWLVCMQDEIVARLGAVRAFDAEVRLLTGPPPSADDHGPGA